jgi:hypothetical protein
VSNSPKVKQAITEAVAELMKMPPEELRAECAARANSDFARAVQPFIEGASLKVMKTPGPFTGREFSRLPPSDLHNEVCAEIANAKLAELWAALESYDHAALEDFMRRDCGNVVLTAFRALRDGKKT